MYSREQALKDPHFLKLRTAKMNSSRISKSNPEKLKQELAKQLDEFVRLQNAREHYNEAIKLEPKKVMKIVNEIKVKLGFKEHPEIVKRYCQGKQTPRNLSLEIFGPKTASLKVKTRFDNEMSELTGHYLFASSYGRRGFQSNDEDKTALERLAELASRKTGKTIRVSGPYKRKEGKQNKDSSFFRVEVGHAGLNSTLLSLTNNAEKIPFEKLEDEEKSTRFLRGALARPGGSVYYTKNAKRLGLNFYFKRKKHLAPQLAVLLTHHSIFPKLDTKRGFLFINDRRELQKLVEMNVLAKSQHEKLKALLETTEDTTRSKRIELYEEFQKRLHEEKPLDGLGLSFNQISRWRRFVSIPEQVARYFKLRKIALNLKLPIKEFKHTIQAEEEKGVRGKILATGQPIEENPEEAAIKRQEIKKAMAILTPRQRKAVEKWLAGEKMDSNAVAALRKMREKKKGLI